MRLGCYHRYLNLNRRAALNRLFAPSWAALPYDTDCSFRKDSFGDSEFLPSVLTIVFMWKFILRSAGNTRQGRLMGMICVAGDTGVLAPSTGHPLYCKTKFGNV